MLLIGLSKMKKDAMVLIDPQYDFCDKHGTFYVEGATRDMFNASLFLRRHKHRFGFVGLTGDDHNYTHISHAAFWLNEKYTNPFPFQVITSQDVKEGKWIPTRDFEYVVNYLEKIEALGKQHQIWPTHCCAGTLGSNFVSEVITAVNEWEVKNKLSATVLHKGNLWYAEQLSPFSLATGEFINTSFVDELKNYGMKYFAGEAYSHCLKLAIIDAVNLGIPANEITVLTNCTSPIAGCDMTDFEEEYKAKGMRFCETSEIG